MRGYLEQRGKGIWRAKLYLGRTEEGGRRYLSRTIHGSKREAEDALAHMLVETGAGAHLATKGTVRDLAMRWLRTATPNLSPTTVAEYERLLNRHVLPRLGKTKVRALRAADLDAFYADLYAKGGQRGRSLSASTVRHVHAVMRSMLEQGVKWGWLTTNPATRATPPKLRRKPIRPPAPDDVLALIAAADPDLACYLRLAAVTGARRGEMCALRWSDLDAFAGTLSITRAVVGRRNDHLAEKSTKTAVGRTIALDKGTVMALLDHRQRCIDRALACDVGVADDAFMFSPEPDGSRPWRPDGITLAFGRLRGRLPLKSVRLHDLRHAAATQMLAAGVPVPIVSGRLGHASPATTMSTYAHWIAKGDEAAADVLGDLLSGPRNGDEGEQVVGRQRYGRESAGAEGPEARSEKADQR